ncbi:hypothetical protein PL263_13880 [Methylomonas sp. EFPC3]|uniref:hypothetical protein n=1 Tax=Methylomonas sp. EFPC3 TaxID=3021710 RepID=UPI00241669FB|nr:hypothetical protein [Methylomonas sp. EFPC3]WFP49183.1 hypothetical protein PL263_13880 [Methylomonas sp. EFPC3]
MASTFGGACSGHSLTVNIQNVATDSPSYNAWADKLTVLKYFDDRAFNTESVARRQMNQHRKWRHDNDINTFGKTNQQQIRTISTGAHQHGICE